MQNQRKSPKRMKHLSIGAISSALSEADADKIGQVLVHLMNKGWRWLKGCHASPQAKVLF